MAKFLFGADRMIMLRDRLRSLQQKAEVFILTANTACHSRDKRSSMLIELIRQILPTIDRQHVLCSSDFGGSKGRAIQTFHHFFERRPHPGKEPSKSSKIRKYNPSSSSAATASASTLTGDEDTEDEDEEDEEDKQSYRFRRKKIKKIKKKVKSVKKKKIMKKSRNVKKSKKKSVKRTRKSKKKSLRKRR